MGNDKNNSFNGNSEIYKMFLEDASTSLYNRDYFIRNINKFAMQMIDGMKENIEHHNQNRTWTILFCDIDGLKLANDIIGHLEADEGIKHIADIIKNSIRTNREEKDCAFFLSSKDPIEQNIPIRVGGDEFIILLPNCTKEKAILVENRIKNKISQDIEKTKHMTLSIGSVDTTEVEIPLSIQNEENIKEYIKKLIFIAEERMYKDKNKNVRSLTYEEQKFLLLKQLNRAAGQIGLNLNKENDVAFLARMFNDIFNDRFNDIDKKK